MCAKKDKTLTDCCYARKDLPSQHALPLPAGGARLDNARGLVICRTAIILYWAILSFSQSASFQPEQVSVAIVRLRNEIKMDALTDACSVAGPPGYFATGD